MHRCMTSSSFPATASAKSPPPVDVLRAVAARHGHAFRFHTHAIGGAAIDATGEPLPAATLEPRGAPTRSCSARSAARSGPTRTPACAGAGLLAIRKALGLYANLRPVKLHLATPRRLAPVKPHLLQGVDLVVVRELTGGIYFGDKVREADAASDLFATGGGEVERVVRVAAGWRGPPRAPDPVDKANVLRPAGCGATW